MQPPAFWHAREGREAAPLLRALLSPLGWVQGALTARRIARTIPLETGLPVVSVGNISLGGTGKTPIARLLRSRLSAITGGAVAIVSRGHGGSLKGPVRVDQGRHNASEVGDEPWMLAADGPVYVGRDRPAAARLAASDGISGLILDDAHQNPAVGKSLSLVVIDTATGFGNGALFPAGPLREKPEIGLARADAVILMGAEEPDWPVRDALEGFSRPVLRAQLAPDPAQERLESAGPLLAFCGIGRPAKFHDTLVALGADLADLIPFSDHHPYVASDLKRLEEAAMGHGAKLVTTEKDAARLPATFLSRVRVVRIAAVFEDPAALDTLLHKAVAR